MPFSFSLFFFVFPSPFAVPRFPPFLFASPFSVCFLWRLLRFSFDSPALIGGGFCSFVSVLHPLRAACEPARLRVSLAYRLLSCLAFLVFIYFIFLLFLPCFFDFDFDAVRFMLSFFCGYYAASSISVSVATRSSYDMYLMRTYADVTFSFFV